MSQDGGGEELNEDDGLRHRRATSAAAPQEEEAPPPVPQKFMKMSADDKYAKSQGMIADFAKNHLGGVIAAFRGLEKVVDLGVVVFNFAYQLYEKAYEEIHKYQEPDDIVKFITGFVLMFFGGFFITLVACIQAFRQGGSHRLVKNLLALREQFDHADLALEKDDAVDDNGDGVPDVLQISAEELASRRILVVLRACDPLVVQEAMSALYTSAIAVVATLRVKFARTISLGASIGDYIYKPVSKFVIPAIEQFTPREYHKWYPLVFGYVSRAIGASIAFQIQRILSTVSTAVQGGHMCLEAAAELSRANGLPHLTDGFIDDVLVWLFVIIGIYAQLFLFTYLPMIFKILLFPFFFVEWMLTVTVSIV